jgi:hypothetical protein
MSRYFFHVINSEFMPDPQGMECSTPDEVKDQAVHIAGAMLKDQGLTLWETGNFHMFVCDEQNKTHLKLSFVAEDLTVSSKKNSDSDT